MQETKITLALIGFEFEHHVPAVKIAIEKLKNENVRCEVKIWSSRDGIKSKVESEFYDCNFIDSGLGHLGKLPRCDLDTLIKEKITLSPLEIKHFSYTFSRTTFFTNPQNITKKKVENYKTLVSRAILLLSSNPIYKYNTICINIIPKAFVGIYIQFYRVR